MEVQVSSNTKWQLSGNAAELYETFLVPTIFVPWAQHILGKIVPERGDNILDVACGTGIVARMAKARVGKAGRVVGVDLNAGMLDVARAIAADRSIEWLEADVTLIPLEDGIFDICYCQQGLQFFPDKVGALREIARLLKPGGICVAVVAQSLDQNPLMRSQVTALEKHINKEAAAGIRAVCGLADKAEIKGLFESAGYSDVEGKTVDLTITYPDGRAFVKNGIMSTPVAGLITSWDDEARDMLLEDVLLGFGDYYTGKSLTFPHVSTVIVGRKP
jgi:ubiquinone/menaquinone biosynthesis C-methylase UbiE